MDTGEPGDARPDSPAEDRPHPAAESDRISPPISAPISSPISSPISLPPSVLPSDPAGRGSTAATWALTLLLVAVVALGATLVRGSLHDRETVPPAAAPSPSTSEAQRPTPDPVQEREAALAMILDRRAAAVLAGDPAGWSVVVDQTSVDFAARQAAVMANMAAVPFATFEYDFAGPGLALSPERQQALGEDAWVARVILAYRLADADTADVRRELFYTVVRRSGQWLLADDTDGPSALDLWDLGPVQVVRGDRSLVVGTGEAAALQAYADQTDVSAALVDEVWGVVWPRVVVVVVPGDQAQMAGLLQRDDQTGLEQIAAVTTGEVGLPSGGSADRIIVNPAGFDQLDEVSRGVVLTHEITHVATRSTSALDAPIWLSEGFADYVAYQGTELPRRSVAADVLELVRAGTGPTALPDAAAFDPANGDIAPAYSGSWLAAELVARTYGQEVLVEFYRAVTGTGVVAALDDEAPSQRARVDEAFRSVLGTEQALFVKQWQAYLGELAA